MLDAFLKRHGNSNSPNALSKKLRRVTGFERLEDRSLLAAMPFGALPSDTGEFLLGKVAVTPVFFESNGSIDTQTQDWTPEEIDEVLAKIADGVNWWSDLLDTMGTVHNLDFVIDDTYAVNPVSTPYEPIDRPSSDFLLYAGGFLVDQGQDGSGTIEDAVYGFKQTQREKLGTDWSFTIFVVDSSDDADGLFASGGNFAAAFAYAGGLFVVTPSTRPASTIAHEMGHIFWARDEYPGASSWTDRRGYYDTQNMNAADNPTPGFQQQISIMRGGYPLAQAYESYVSPATTLAMVGWQDSDNDGVFDVADVPLELEGTGYYDLENSQYRFSGKASAVPLFNRNSSGNQSDITLNQISEIQYRLDGGSWLTALAPAVQQLSFDVQVTITEPFSEIEWRAIDAETGITSPILHGTDSMPAVPMTGLTGLVFVDENQNGIKDSSDTVLPATQITLTYPDGSPLYHGAVEAADLPDGPISSTATELNFIADSAINGGQVAIQDSNVIPNTKTFQYFDLQRDRWIDRWNEMTALEIVLNSDVGEFAADVLGYQNSSYARMEAYDASGNLVDRVTSKELINNEQIELLLQREVGDIRRVRIFGHLGTSVTVSRVSYGFEPNLKSDENGIWHANYLPAGQYRAQYQADRVIHDFSPSSQTIDVDHSIHQVEVITALRVNSPKHNADQSTDVNQDEVTSAADALAIINNLTMYSSRQLSWDDPQSSKLT